MSSREPLPACIGAARPLRSLLPALIAVLALAPGAPAVSRSVSAPAAPRWSPAGQTFLTRDEALGLAFPKCEIKRQTVYLDSKALAQVTKLAKVEFKSKVVYSYLATRDGKCVGTAYFDTHRVRTLRETLMVVVKPDCTIARIELLSFAEPRDYIPRARWYAQFPGRKLDKQLNLKQKIRPVTGATLTAQATTECARRVLALHTHLQRPEAVRRKEIEAKPGKRVVKTSKSDAKGRTP